MALNTNGWDYIYSANIAKLNDLMLSKGYSTLVDSSISADILDSGGTTTEKEVVISKLIISKFSVLSTSHYPNLDVSMTLKGHYYEKKLTSTTPEQDFDFKDVTFNIKIDINWLNRSENSNTIANTDIVVPTSVVVPSVPANPISGDLKTLFDTILQNYFNATYTTQPIKSPIDRKYKKYYDFFKSLNSFYADTTKGLNWMEPTTQVFSVKKDVHQTDSDESCIFSFCCMIKDKPNKDIGYVDINAIPALSTSALVIERSVFGEYMVQKKMFSLFDSGVQSDFIKYSPYSFVLNEERTLKSQDYKTNNSTTTKGRVNKNKCFVNVEEDKLKIILSDVEYIYGKTKNYDSDIKALINQEYIVSFSYTSGVELKIEEINFNVNPEYPKLKESNWGQTLWDSLIWGYQIPKIIKEVFLPVGFWLYRSIQDRKSAKINPDVREEFEQDATMEALTGRGTRELGYIVPNTEGLTAVINFTKYLPRKLKEIVNKEFTAYIKEVSKKDYKIIYHTVSDDQYKMSRYIDAKKFSKLLKNNNLTGHSCNFLKDEYKCKLEIEDIYPYSEINIEKDEHGLKFSGYIHGELIDEESENKTSTVNKDYIFSGNEINFSITNKELKSLSNKIIDEIILTEIDIDKYQKDLYNHEKEKIKKILEYIKKIDSNKSAEIDVKLKEEIKDYKKIQERHKNSEMLQAFLTPIADWGLETASNAITYHISVQQAHEQFNLDKYIKGNRNKDDATESFKAIAKANLKVELPSAPSGSSIRSIALNGAFIIAFQ